MRRVHRMPFGAELRSDGATRFRIWAPACRRLSVRLGEAGDREVSLEPEPGGWFSAVVADAPAGTLYRFRTGDGPEVPDPASRFQPDGPHGPSEVIDPAAYRWGDDGWTGRPFASAVFCEIHPGAFSPQGGYDGVRERLDELVDVGVTAIELMPLSEFPGRWNWGYDGVLPFAPAHRYGRPEALKALVDAAHESGLMVFLDVVDNHFGPDGNHLSRTAPGFFTRRHVTPWGDAIDFETPAHRPVRDYFVENAVYWLREYHLDGLRFDAVHAIHDASRPHVLEEIAAAVRDRLPEDRRVHLVLENDANEAHRLTRDDAGRPETYAAQWNDDVHHALHVLITGETDGYYEDVAPEPARALGRALAEGFAAQGEHSVHRGAPRGEPSAHLPPTAFVSFLQNHDQIGNRAHGERIDRLAPPEAVRAATLVLLMAPSPPLLFMGQEWGAPEPFPFFCDFGGDLAEAVRSGRRREFERFLAFGEGDADGPRLPDPCARETFESAVLDRSRREVSPHREILAEHRDLLRIRRERIVPRLSERASFAGRYDCLSRSTVRVAWRLAGDARLEIVAHLAAGPLEGLDLRPDGELLAATHPGMAAAGRILRAPAWFAGCWLREGG